MNAINYFKLMDYSAFNPVATQSTHAAHPMALSLDGPPSPRILECSRREYGAAQVATREVRHLVPYE